MNTHQIILTGLLLALPALSSPSSYAAPLETLYGEWRSGRIGGGGYCINVVPTSEPRIYYMYTDVGGFYRSDDGGSSWRMIHGALPPMHGSQEPRSLLVDPRDPDTFLVAVGSHWSKERDGVYRSNDGGKTYIKTLEAAFAGNSNNRMWGTILAADPNNPDVVLAGAMKDGVFRSEDFGVTWEKVGLEGTNPSDIDFDIKTPGRVVLCSMPYNFFLLGNDKTVLKRGFFESIDGGKTWTELAGVSPAPFEVAQMSEAFNGDWIGLFPSLRIKRSNDGGKTWTDFHEGLPANDPAGVVDEEGVISAHGAVAPFTFAALGVGPDFVVAGAGDGSVYRRGAKDPEWQKVEGKAEAPDDWYGNDGSRPGWVHFGKAISSLVVDPHAPNTWWLCDWYMLWRSTNAGKLWSYAGDGLEITCIHNVSQAPDDPGLVYMGMGDNGFFRSTDGGSTYQQNWKVITNNIKDIAVSPKDSARLYAIGPDLNGHWYSNQLFVSGDRGSTWAVAAMGGTRGIESRRVNSVAADPNDRETVYITVNGNPSGQGGVFRSKNSGQTFEAINVGLPEEGLFRAEIWHVGREIAASKDGSLSAISHDLGKVFAFDPKTQTWTESSLADAMERPNSIAADPFVPGRYIMAALKGGLFESTDSGKTWHKIGVKLPAYHVAFDYAVPGRAAVGTEDGVYLTTDGGKEWELLDSALPNRRGNMVGFAGDRVIVGTTGCGMFWLPLTPEAARPILATSITAQHGVQGIEIVKNGSFTESGDAGIPMDWRLRWAETDGRVTEDPAVFISEPVGLNIAVQNPGYCVVEQELPADLAGKWISFSGYVKTEGEFEESFLAVQLMDETDQQIAWMTIFAPSKDNAEWQSFEKTIEMPKEYSKAFLLYHIKGSGNIWLDDLSGKASDPR